MTAAGVPDRPRTGERVDVEQGVRYEFRVSERMSPTAAAAFPQLTVDEHGTGMVLYGPIRDRAELHGVLDRLHLLGLTVTEVHRLPD